MLKEHVKSILVANSYFTKCKIENKCCNRTELAKKYLVKKIRKALTEKKTNYSGVKGFFTFLIGILGFN
jgi:hypothetical protein